MNDDDKDLKKRNKNHSARTCDNRGRWVKGHCRNPKGRPRKKREDHFDPADIYTFGNTMVEVRTNSGTELMDRRAALKHKMFEEAMRGKVTAQRFLYEEFRKNDAQLAATLLRYEQLVTHWFIENEDSDEFDSDSIPLDVRLEILKLESLLRHYFPGRYADRNSKVGDDDAD